MSRHGSGHILSLARVWQLRVMSLRRRTLASNMRGVGAGTFDFLRGVFPRRIARAPTLLKAKRAVAAPNFSFRPKSKTDPACSSTSSMPGSTARPLKAHAAAPTLVVAPSSREAATTTPSPAKKKVAKKTKGKKKTAASSAYASMEGAGDEGPDSEKWLDEQKKLTQLMNKMYSGDFDPTADNGGADDEDEEEEDHLAYYDYEAEEKALAARVAELKRVSSLPLSFAGAGASSSSADGAAVPATPKLDMSKLVDVSDAEPPLRSARSSAAAAAVDKAEKQKATRAAAAAAARLFTPRSQRTQREQQRAPELEPFCIGRQSDRDRFEEVEVTIVPASPASSSSAAADAAANRNNNTTAAADQQQQPQPQQKEEGNGSPSTSESEGEASTSASSSAAVKTTDAAATSTVPAGEPPLTPRSLASSIAARRQANHKSRIHENGALTPRGSRAQQSPTGAA